jgi:predicted DNA-binding transcriptional regulator YafY
VHGFGSFLDMLTRRVGQRLSQVQSFPKKLSMPRSKELSRPPLARMLRLHERLQGGARPNCRGLAIELEVSAKTVQRDIDFMRDQLGLPLDYDPVARGFYYTRRVVQFPTMKISEGELVALSVARKALAQYQGTPFERPLRDAFEKLTSGLRDQIHFAWSSDLDGSISFRAAGQSISDLGTFEAASQGVLRSEELAFGYRKLGSDLVEERCVQPVHLACIDNQWYLFGLDPARGSSLRTFALTRMTNLHTTGRAFERPPHFSLDEHLADSFGVRSAPVAEQVRLRFDAFGGRLIQERIWHASQQIDPRPDGGLDLTLKVGLSPEVVRWILGWAEHVEVLEPPGLRAEIAHTAGLILERYAG